MIVTKEVAQLQACVNELEGALVATIMTSLREAKSLKKSMEMVRIDKY